MADLIQSTQINLAAIQADAAEASLLARRLAGTVTDEIQARRLLDLLLRRISTIKGAILTLPQIQIFGTLSSETYNRFMEDLNLDLRTLYDTMLTVEATNKQMEVVVKSDFSKIKAAILKAINQLRVYQFLKDNPQYQDLKVVDFIRAINETKRRPAAVVDNDIRMLELPVRFRKVVSVPRFGSHRTTVQTRAFGGVTFGGLERDFAPINAVDPDPKTYWVQVVSSDGPIQQNYETSWGTRVASGAIFEIELLLSHASIVNNLKVLPFFEHPYNIVDVAYLESPSSTRWLTLPGFSVQEAVEDWVEFDFPYISVASLRIVIEQPNFVRTISAVPESLLRRNQLWAQFRSAEYLRSLHELDLTARQEGKVAVEPEQLAYLSALERVDQNLVATPFSGERRTEYQDYARYIDAVGRMADQIAPGVSDDVREQVSGTRTAVKDPIKTVVSYDYLAGLRSVVLSDLTYETHAHYESGEFVTAATVIEASLEVDERHYNFLEDDGNTPYRRTSIEYDLEISPSTRFPIVPVTWLEGDTYMVRDEYLHVVNATAKTRFTPAAAAYTVRRNGTRVAASSITLSGRDVTISGWDPGAIYTITYAVPEASTKVAVDGVLDSTRLIRPEEYDGTDRDNKITIKYYPYVIYEIVRAKRYWTPREGQARWDWTPEFFPLSEGSVALNNGSATVTLTQDDPADRDFTDIPFDRFTGTENLKIWIQETGETLTLDPDALTTALTCSLAEAYAGEDLASTRFIIGRTITHDSRIFGLNLDFYEPIEVIVDGVRAVNRTDYLSGEHPVMEPRKEGETRFEYIQAGKNLFFNGPITGKKILVSYNWLTQYLKVMATLRCNVPVSTIFTPKLDSARVRVKTTDL